MRGCATIILLYYPPYYLIAMTQIVELISEVNLILGQQLLWAL